MGNDTQVGTYILRIRLAESQKLQFGRFKIEHYTDTQIVEKSLGANDAPKYTHVMQVNPDEKWWDTLTRDITDTFCSVNP